VETECATCLVASDSLRCSTAAKSLKYVLFHVKREVSQVYVGVFMVSVLCFIQARSCIHYYFPLACVGSSLYFVARIISVGPSGFLPEANWPVRCHVKPSTLAAFLVVFRCAKRRGRRTAAKLRPVPSPSRGMSERGQHDGTSYPFNLRLRRTCVICVRYNSCTCV